MTVLFFQIKSNLTSIWTQYVQTNPITAVATSPNTSPAFIKAKGIANMPEPRLPFSRCINVSISLKMNNSKFWYHNFLQFFFKLNYVVGYWTVRWSNGL